MHYRFRDCSHPLSNGDVPEPGENAFVVTIPTEEHGTLRLEIGRQGLVYLGALLKLYADGDERLEQEIEEAAGEIAAEEAAEREGR